MTDNTPPEATESPVSDGHLETGLDTTSESEAVTDESEAFEDKSPSREAAKWRVKFRDAEARVARLQRAEITRQAGEVLIDGEDLFNAVDVAELLDDDGDLDAEKIAEQVTALVEAKPHLRKPAFGDGAGVGARGETTKPVSWADILAG